MRIETSALPAHDGPIAGLALGGRFLGWLLLADTPRPEAAAAMADLRDLGVSRPLPGIDGHPVGRPHRSAGAGLESQNC
jgi:hypothetical protein